jgi:hypothetical protein
MLEYRQPFDGTTYEFDFNEAELEAEYVENAICRHCYNDATQLLHEKGIISTVYKISVHGASFPKKEHKK